MIGSSNVGVCDRFCLKFVPSLLHSEDSSVLTVPAVPALTDLCEHLVTHPSQFLPVLLLFKLPGSWRNCPLMRRSGTGVFKLLREVKSGSVGGDSKVSDQEAPRQGRQRCPYLCPQAELKWFLITRQHVAAPVRFWFCFYVIKSIFTQIQGFA